MPEHKEKYSIPLDMMSVNYNIPKGELLFILLRRNVKYELDNNQNKTFFLNDNDLEYLNEMGKFNKDIEVIKSTISELISFLTTCIFITCFDKKMLLTQNKYDSYKKCLEDCYKLFYIFKIDDLMREKDIKAQEAMDDLIKSQVEKIKELEAIIKTHDNAIEKHKHRNIKEIEALTDAYGKYKEENKILKAQIAKLTKDLNTKRKSANENKSDFWSFLKNKKE